MRVLSVVLSFCLSVPSFARATPTVPVDQELWTSLKDLKSRAFVARAARLARVGYGAGMLAAWMSLPVAYHARNRHPRLSHGAGKISAVGILTPRPF